MIVMRYNRAQQDYSLTAPITCRRFYDLKTISDRARWVSGCSTGCGIADLRYHCARVSDCP